MTANDFLNVWYQNTLVGRLWQNSSGKIGFSYEQSWLNQGFPISQQLPLDALEYSPESGKAHQFFVNLLPEAGARIHIVKNLKIADTDFGLLKAIGGECAGALSILPDQYKPNAEIEYKSLSNDELKKIIVRKGQIYDLTSNENRPRLSLAGAQDKCAIFTNDHKNYQLPERAAPSTHILKFDIAGYRNIPVYEYFTNRLANAIGLPVVETQLVKYEKTYFLLIKRYDRILKNQTEVTRLHQEDLCQALGFGYEKKYQQEGGPSFSACYQMIQNKSINPFKDAENLLRWQIFNVLAGNSDGHAKNLAFLYNPNHQPELAPFYDLVCTRAIDGIDRKLAMSVGNEFDPDNITHENWQQMAQECDIRFSYLQSIIQELTAKIFDNFTEIHEQFTETFGSYPALQRVQKVILKQYKKSLRSLTASKT